MTRDRILQRASVPSRLYVRLANEYFIALNLDSEFYIDYLQSLSHVNIVHEKLSHLDQWPHLNVVDRIRSVLRKTWYTWHWSSPSDPVLVKKLTIKYIYSWRLIIFYSFNYSHLWFNLLVLYYYQWILILDSDFPNITFTCQNKV